MANVCLRSKSALPFHLYVQSCASSTYVDFRILKPFLQIIIYSLVRYLADEGKIRNSDLLLLGALKGGLSDLGLPPSAAGRLRIASVFLAAGALGYCLSKLRFSLVPKVGEGEGNPHTMVVFFGLYSSTVFARPGGWGHGSFEEVEVGHWH